MPVTDSSVYRIMNQLRPADHTYTLLSSTKMQQQPDNYVFPSHHDHSSVIKLATDSLHQLYKIKNNVEVFCHLRVWLTLEPDPIQHNSLDRLQITKLQSTTLLFEVVATLQPIRLACCLRTTALSATTKQLCFEPTVWTDTCCNLCIMRVLVQWTKLI